MCLAGAMTHFEDYALAQSIRRELLELRARANSGTSVVVSLVNPIT
jgi:hypothetical protein